MSIATTDPKAVQTLSKLNGQLAFLEVALMGIRQSHGNRSLLGQMARSVQSIRGICRNAGWAEMELLACDLCDLLQQWREMTVDLTSSQLNLMQRCIDVLRDSAVANQSGHSECETLRSLNDEVRRVVSQDALLVSVA